MEVEGKKKNKTKKTPKHIVVRNQLLAVVLLWIGIVMNGVMYVNTIKG